MKVALVHDYLVRLGGAERVLFSLRKIFPNAPIYTLIYDKNKLGKYLNNAKIVTSFLQNFPYILRKNYRALLPFIPAAVETLDLSDFDLVISSCSAFCKGIILRAHATHICYCHRPTGFLWDDTFTYNTRFNSIKKIFFHFLRLWDLSAADRVDYFIANSNFTLKRIKKFYRKSAEVIYPPVQLGIFRPQENHLQKSGYFLIVSQLTYYKRIDIAIEAFNKLELPLIIIGEGRERKKLQKMANRNIKFLGFLEDEKVKEYYKNCIAFIFPGKDDFGISPVEAMSFGKPVLAFRGGGALEIILEGETGEFFDDLHPASLADGARRILKNLKNYNPFIIRKRAEEFSEEKFILNFKKFLSRININVH